MNDPGREKKKCNCRKEEECPLRGECQEGPVVYQAVVRTNTSAKKYIGSTGLTFKERYYGHKRSLDNREANSTALSSHVWALKDAEKEYEISWSIRAKTGVYTAGAKFCDVCLTEKTHILLAEPKDSLNVRSEILNTCRHKAKFTLAKL